MNRYQITADIDATVWLGVLEDFQYALTNIDYAKLSEIFEFGGIHIPSRNELGQQLATLSKDIKKEFKLYLREIADISVTTFYYRDKVFVDPRSLKVYMVVYICVSIEVTLDNEKSIDREKLFKLIENRYADFAWYGELSRYTIRTSFGELEIEYR